MLEPPTFALLRSDKKQHTTSTHVCMAPGASGEKAGSAAGKWGVAAWQATVAIKTATRVPVGEV
jgi:hypothetical protein